MYFRNKLNVFNITYHISTNLPNLTLLLFLLTFFLQIVRNYVINTATV